MALANALLGVQRARTGRCDDDMAEEAHTHGPAPVLVNATRGEALARLQDIGPRVAVIAPDARTAAGLRENAAARRAVRQCYVGVTRARRWLAIWEEEAVRDLWLAPALRCVIEQDTDAALQQFGAEAASPGEWEEQAQYYLARGRYRQAEECFRRAGNVAAARRAEAEAVAAAGEAVRAAELFVELGEHERAIALLAGAREEERAAQVCEQLGREGEAWLWQAAGCTKEARRCHARIARAGQSASMLLELSQAEQRRKTMCEWALAHPLCTRAEISAGIGVPMASLVNDWPYMKLNQEMAYGTYDRRYYYAARAWCAEHGIAVDEYGEMDRHSLHAVLQRRAAEASAPASVAAQGAGATTNPTRPELFA